MIGKKSCFNCNKQAVCKYNEQVYRIKFGDLEASMGFGKLIRIDSIRIRVANAIASLCNKYNQE